jgi:hypothetical protein
MLTTVEIRALKPATRPFKVPDSTHRCRGSALADILTSDADPRHRLHFRAARP